MTVRWPPRSTRTSPGRPGEVLGGGWFAAATPPRPYDQLARTAHALLAWAGEHGHAVGDRLREVYLSDPRHTAAAQPVTQLMCKLNEEQGA